MWMRKKLYNWSIFNLAGQLMLQKTIILTKHMILQSLKNGAYFIKMSDEKGTSFATQKLMLIKVNYSRINTCIVFLENLTNQNVFSFVSLSIIP